MMTINNKSARNNGGKCLGWPVTSYSPDVPGGHSLFSNCTEQQKPI